MRPGWPVGWMAGSAIHLRCWGTFSQWPDGWPEGWLEKLNLRPPQPQLTKNGLDIDLRVSLAMTLQLEDKVKY